MSLLQAILSDGSFENVFETVSPIHLVISKNFSTDILLSLVLPNLVWRSGGLAAALRKLSVAIIFLLFSHHQTHHDEIPTLSQTFTNQTLCIISFQSFIPTSKIQIPLWENCAVTAFLSSWNKCPDPISSQCGKLTPKWLIRIRCTPNSWHYWMTVIIQWEWMRV